MVRYASQEWFLEVKGKRTGPFTTEQVLGLLADKEIPETQRITASMTDDRWITVKELAEDYRHTPQATPPKHFVPPPRPTELQHPSEGATPSTSAHAHVPLPESDASSAEARDLNKPEHSLFEALLAAKDRKANAGRALPPHSDGVRPNPFSFENIPISRNSWLMAAMAILLGSATWAMVHFIKQKATSEVVHQPSTLQHPSQTADTVTSVITPPPLPVPPTPPTAQSAHFIPPAPPVPPAPPAQPTHSHHFGGVPAARPSFRIMSPLRWHPTSHSSASARA